jgi:hypothetical protein
MTSVRAPALSVVGRSRTRAPALSVVVGGSGARAPALSILVCPTIHPISPGGPD